MKALKRYKIWKRYKNGNYTTIINILNGTKIRETEDDEFIPDFAENIDILTSTVCENECPWCFIEGTKILMSDFTYKNIEDVKIGDDIIGFEETKGKSGGNRKIFVSKVINTFQHVESEIIHVKTESGLEIYSTPNHPFLNGGMGANHNRIFSRIEDIKVGKPLYSIALPMDRAVDYYSEEYKLGYVIGAWCGDGTRCHNVDKRDRGGDLYLCRFVTKDNEINEQVMNYTKEFIPEFYYNDFNMHGEIVRAVTNASCLVYNKMNNLIDSNIGKYNSIEYASGFCAGMFDSEGHIDKQRHIIRITNTNTDYINEIVRCLDILGIENCVETNKDPERYSKGYKQVYKVRIKGRFNWYIFLWYTRPVCKRKTFEHNVLESIEYRRDNILEKNRIYKKQYVYNLETECHTYIANNYFVHNCYAGCTMNGKHGDLLKWKFLDTLHPYTELALNLNFPMPPDFEQLLHKLKEKKIIANVTVAQNHFEKHHDLIKSWIDKKLIYGVGVSLSHTTPEFVKLIQQFPTAVIHTINGITSPYNLTRLYELSNDTNKIKILILGYKDVGRGISWKEETNGYIKKYQDWTYRNLDKMRDWFSVLSFDNLALEQLNVRRLLTEKQWEEFYMGDDGGFTFFIDLVDGTFGKNSLATKRYPIMDSVDDMFNFIRNEEDGDD